MKRGELYLVAQESASDPKKNRVFVIVSSEVRVASRFATLICAPVFSQHKGLPTQVAIGIADGLRHECSIHCEELQSIPSSALTRQVGTLKPAKLKELDKALKIALGLPK